jgi:hypothetical protein
MLVIFFDVTGEIRRDSAQKPCFRISKREIEFIPVGVLYYKTAKIIDKSVEHLNEWLRRLTPHLQIRR